MRNTRPRQLPVSRPSLVDILFLFVTLSGALMACQQAPADPAEKIKGNWLVLYADHELENNAERVAYGKVQDSIIALLGLKTVSFSDESTFIQTDSIFHAPGKWNYNPGSNKIYIRNGGKGWEFFEGKLVSVTADLLKIVEDIKVDGQTISLTWHFKKVTDAKRLKLFEPQSNAWRKPTVGETEDAIHERLRLMLRYYAIYFEMVAKESSYFSPSRVFLPMRYYQHGVGLRQLKPEHPFHHYFPGQQSIIALRMLKSAIRRDRRPFPSGADFVIEYSQYFDHLADAMD